MGFREETMVIAAAKIIDTQHIVPLLFSMWGHGIFPRKSLGTAIEVL